MPYTRLLVILANSYKLQARCVAGKAIRQGVPAEWIRPVNPNHNGGAVSERDTHNGDGKSPALLDIVNITFAGKSGHAYQPENHGIDTNFYWDKVGVANREMLGACVDEVSGPLWFNGDSSYNGINDRMSEQTVVKVEDSLKLVFVDGLYVSVISGFGGKKKVRAVFSLAGHHYNFGVTDPEWHAYYLSQGEGMYTFGTCYLCISISEPLDGFTYKLVAGMIRT